MDRPRACNRPEEFQRDYVRLLLLEVQGSRGVIGMLVKSAQEHPRRSGLKMMTTQEFGADGVIICFRSRLGYEIEWSFLCRVVDQVKKGDCCERSRYGDTVCAVGPV